jgi:hypothetical protein
MSKTIEELLELVNSRQSTGRKPKEDHKDVLSFIEDLKVEAGTLAVPNYIIFYIYRMVWKTYNSRKAKKITFFQTFGKYLPDYRHGKQRFYLIKEDVFTITDELRKEALDYDQHYWKAKKTQKKVSIP